MTGLLKKKCLVLLLVLLILGWVKKVKYHFPLSLAVWIILLSGKHFLGNHHHNQNSYEQQQRSEGKQLFLSLRCGWRKLQCQCRNNMANHSLQTNNFCSNFMPRRVTELLPGGKPCESLWCNQTIYLASQVTRTAWQGSSHFSAADMHRQVGLLESSGKTQPLGSLVPALEIPLASPSCASAEPQKHVSDSRTTKAQTAAGVPSCSLVFR